MSFFHVGDAVETLNGDYRGKIRAVQVGIVNPTSYTVVGTNSAGVPFSYDFKAKDLIRSDYVNSTNTVEDWG